MIDDLYFEEELKRRKKKEVENRLNRLNIFFKCGNSMSEITQSVLQQFDYVLDEYFFSKYGKETEYDEIDKMTQEFMNQFTDNNLEEMFEKMNFTEEEMDYMKLVQISRTWGGMKDYNINAKYALVDILIKRKIIENFGEESIPIFNNLLQLDMFNESRFSSMKKHFMQLLSDNPYGQNIHEKLEKCIDKESTYWFNQMINCGGYALKVDRWIEPTRKNDAGQAVSTILNQYNFVRLLGDTRLEEDEYMVIYRTRKGENTGHHFIRIDEDGVIREKDGSNNPKLFSEWSMKSKEKNECVDYIFAVKKEHKMFGYESSDVNYNGKNFEESTEEAIRNKQNQFLYHCQKFFLKKSEQDQIYVAMETGRIVAEVLVDGDECIVDVNPENEGFVENYMGKVKPIIENGKLINYAEFQKNRQSKIKENIER